VDQRGDILAARERIVLEVGRLVLWIALRGSLRLFQGLLAGDARRTPSVS